MIDAYHPDLRRTRAASQSIIPVDTKLSLGIERILPKFEGRFEAIAVSATINVTAMDLSVTVKSVDVHLSIKLSKMQRSVRCKGFWTIQKSLLSRLTLITIRTHP